MESGIAGPIDVKSIGELRDKGENRRFMDDMGYLLEGLDQEMTIAVKRLRYVFFAFCIFAARARANWMLMIDV